MKVLITGADGYIGRALARRLAAPGATLQGRAIDQLTLCDLRLPEAPQAPQVRAVAGSRARHAMQQMAPARSVRPLRTFISPPSIESAGVDAQTKRVTSGLGGETAALSVCALRASTRGTQWLWWRAGPDTDRVS